jgi:hypothetical protein
MLTLTSIIPFSSSFRIRNSKAWYFCHGGSYNIYYFANLVEEKFMENQKKKEEQDHAVSLL